MTLSLITQKERPMKDVMRYCVDMIQTPYTTGVFQALLDRLFRKQSCALLLSDSD